jgi:hypothetical protein
MGGEIQMRKYSEPLHDLDAGISRRVDGDYLCPVCGCTMIWHSQIGFCEYKSRSGIPGDYIRTILRKLCDGSVVEEYPR